MTTTIYLTGQSNFGNRGCEALVRSTVATLRAQLRDVRFLVPSLDIPRDSAQWPQANNSGVRFVPAPSVPSNYLQRGRLCRFMPMAQSRAWPPLRNLPHLEEYLRESDAVISIGGDNYSLDYGLTSLFFFVGIAERALELGKKVALWGASVGPFSGQPRVQALMCKHLSRLHMISVRESHSLDYLRSIGVTDNVVSVTDSAFVLGRQAVALDRFWPATTSGGVLGLNVSPLIEKVYARAGQPGSVKEVTAAFIESVLAETDMSVLLVPHVAALDGARFNNDELYMAEIARMVRDHSGRLAVVPSGMNACQLKDIIAHCRFFVGARTHATIAALSSTVPTVSIAYSVKARGINRDLFGHEDHVLPTPKLSVDALNNCVRQLIADEDAIRQKLISRMPHWQSMGRVSANVFSEQLKEKETQNA
jgi:polysaccharide pyruvyl transferase WcaK-like protein